MPYPRGSTLIEFSEPNTDEEMPLEVNVPEGDSDDDD